MATSLDKAQIPFRVKGQTTCIHHKGKQLELYCEECQQLACTNCLSTIHRSHSLCRLDQTTPKKKEIIQNYIDKTEKADLVHIDQYITVTEGHLKENASNFEKLSHQLQTRTNKLKQDLDLLAAQTLSLYHQMEEDNAKLLQTYKQDLEMYSSRLKKLVQECKVVLRRGSDIQIYDAGSEIQYSVTLPVKPTLGTASFSPNRNPQNYLEQALGKVNISGQGQGQALQGRDRSVGSSAGQGLFSTQPQAKLKVKTPFTEHISKGIKEVSSPLFTLLGDTKVLGEWETPCIITSVCPTTDGQVWTSYNNSDTLTLLDRNGTVIQKVTHNAEIMDISLSPTTNTLWVCDEENNITELVSGRLVHRFRNREEPLSICITASNHVIVGMAKHISKFTTKGTLLHTTLSAGTRKPLVHGPYRISECPVTNNVAVAASDGGKGKPCVVVMDTDFKVLFVYDGEIPHKYQPTSQSEGTSFNPFGVVYDSVGNLVIGEHNNTRILLISGRGDFLRIIHTDDYMTFAVGVDREDVLWTVFAGSIVRLLKYSSTLDKQQCIIS